MRFQRISIGHFLFRFANQIFHNLRIKYVRLRSFECGQKTSIPIVFQSIIKVLIDFWSSKKKTSSLDFIATDLPKKLQHRLGELGKLEQSLSNGLLFVIRTFGKRLSRLVVTSWNERWTIFQMIDSTAGRVNQPLLDATNDFVFRHL